MKDSSRIIIAISVAVILGFGLYQGQRQSHERQAVDAKLYREWLEKDAARRLAEENARVENKKKPLLEMSAESRNRKCRNNPDQCLLIGMREHDVIEMLGWPDRKNKSTFSALGETHYNEQWVYELWDYQAAYVYFDDGQVSGWQR